MQFRLSIPPLTKILLAFLLIIATVHQATRYIFHTLPLNVLALVPQQSVFYPWVYFTATFAEQNVVTLVIAALTVLYGGKYLERAWGSKEFGKFFAIVTIVPNVIAAITYVAWFAITRDPSRALAYIQGSVALQGAILVAFKQLVPEHTVTILKGLVKIRVKHFPAIFVVANTLSGIIIGTDTALVLAWAGFTVSWIYLRFYKKQADLSGAETSGPAIKGDASETFSFAAFWPDVVQTPISVVTDRLYTLFILIGILKPFSEQAIETSNVQASARGEGGLPSLLNQGRRGGKREEAERRRALALKALDQRLQAANLERQQTQERPAEEQTSADQAPAEAQVNKDPS